MAQPKFDLKAFRQGKGMTQSEFADEIGFSRSYIATVESGKQSISLNLMHVIIRKYGVKYDSFYAYE